MFVEVHVCQSACLSECMFVEKAFAFSSDLCSCGCMQSKKKKKLWSSENPITDREFKARNNCIAGVGPASCLAFGSLTPKAE